MLPQLNQELTLLDTNLNFTKENSKVHYMLTQKLSPVTTPTLLLQILDTSLILLPTSEDLN